MGFREVDRNDTPRSDSEFARKGPGRPRHPQESSAIFPERRGLQTKLPNNRAQILISDVALELSRRVEQTAPNFSSGGDSRSHDPVVSQERGNLIWTTAKTSKFRSVDHIDSGKTLRDQPSTSPFPARSAELAAVTGYVSTPQIIHLMPHRSVRSLASR